MEVYVDVIFFQNFVVDIFLLMVASKVLRKKISSCRIILSGILGGLYSLVMIFPSLNFFSYIPFQFLFLYMIMKISFRKSNVIFKIKGIIVYLIGAFILSGLCVALSMNKYYISVSGGFKMTDYSVKYLILSIMIVYIIYSRLSSYLRERAFITNFIYDIEFFKDNAKYVIRGFLDTGNELREPITNLPCIIVEENFVEITSDKNLYYIPYKAIGYTGKLKGFVGEKVRIREQGGAWRDVDAIICPCNELLSRDGDFNALLSRGII